MLSMKIKNHINSKIIMLTSTIQIKQFISKYHKMVMKKKLIAPDNLVFVVVLSTNYKRPPCSPFTGRRPRIAERRKRAGNIASASVHDDFLTSISVDGNEYFLDNVVLELPKIDFCPVMMLNRYI